MDAKILAPIPGPNPSGADLRYDVAFSDIHERVRRARGEILYHLADPQSHSADADWHYVIATCNRLLTTRTKDLRIAAWLAEAQFVLNGFSGLRDGLEVLTALISNFWPTLFPGPDEPEDDVRPAVLEHASRQLSRAVVSFKADPPNTDARTVVTQLKSCQAALDSLIAICDDTTGEGHFTFRELRDALSQCLKMYVSDLVAEAIQASPAGSDFGWAADLPANDRLEDLLRQLVKPETPAPSKDTSAAAEGGFTQFISAAKPATPAQEPTISAPPPPAATAPPESSGPGEFTRIFQAQEPNPAAAEPGGVTRLIQRLVQEPAAPDPPLPKAAPSPIFASTAPPKVDFTFTAPARVTAGVPFELFVWAHWPQERNRILARAREELQVRDVLARTKGPFSIPAGTALTVRLRILGAAIDDPEDTMIWHGESTCASFVVTLPELNPHIRCSGSAYIYAGGAQIAKIQFLLSSAGAKENVVHVPALRYRTAFASYASDDRDAVLARIQGIHKVVPELDVFLDVLSLRSGQNWEQELWRVIPTSDIFYLFWSTYARKSDWVEREWRCALRERGIGFIDPIPLQPPEESPPPPELSSLHFNDWTLAFRRGRV